MVVYKLTRENVFPFLVNGAKKAESIKHGYERTMAKMEEILELTQIENI